MSDKYEQQRKPFSLLKDFQNGMTDASVAALLGVGQGTISSWRCTGTIPLTVALAIEGLQGKASQKEPVVFVILSHSNALSTVTALMEVMSHIDGCAVTQLDPEGMY